MSVKKIHLRLLSLAAVFLLSLTATQAVAQAKPCLPGCDCPTAGGSVYGAIKNNAEAQRVRARAESREVLTQNDNAMGMSCFDRAMAVTARLGKVFSDQSSASVPPPNSTVFPGTTKAGDGKLMIEAIKDVVMESASKYADKNFDASASEPLGAGSLGFIGSMFSGMGGVMSGLTGAYGQLTAAMNNIQTLMNTINSVISVLQAMLPSAAWAYWPTIQAAFTALQNGQTSLTASLTSGILGQLTSFFNLQDQFGNQAMGIPPTIDNLACLRNSMLWNRQGAVASLPPAVGSLINSFLNAAPGGSFKSIVGSGPQQGVPFLSMQDILSGSFGSAGTNMQQELTNPVNVPILQQALADRATNGALSTPGNPSNPTWTRPPTGITWNTSTQQIISKMNVP